MIIVLTEAQNNVINSVIPKLLANVNSSYVHRIPNEIKPMDVEKYGTPPVMEKGWCVIYGCKDKKVVKLLCSYKDNITILTVNSLAQKESLMQQLYEDNCEFKVIDNLKISRKDKIQYIQNNLHVTEAEATYIVTRTRGRIKDIVSAVGALRSCSHITREQIRAIVPKTEKFSINDLYNYLVGYTIDKNPMTYKDAILILYNYQYGVGFLRDFLMDRLIRDLAIYDLIESDGLSIRNYKEYRHLRGNDNNKILTSLTEYQLYKVIEQHRYVSYEYIYFLLTSLQRMDPSDNLLLAMVNLVLIRKEINNV